MRVLAAFIMIFGLVLPAPAALGDDPISRLMNSADKLPQAPVSRKPAENVSAPAVGSRPKGPLPIVMSARIGEHQDRTRLVLELSDPVNLRAFSLANPDRVVIDMPEVAWKLGAPPRPSGFGAIKSYRYGLFRAGNSRMVVDLNQPVTVGDTLVLPPSNGFGYRVVIDLFPASRAKFDALAGWPADLKKRESDAEKLAAMIAAAQAPEREAARQSGKGTGKGKVIVIDPGHGGLDTGTSGVNGLLEKDLVLAEGLRLAKVLKARGYSVYMTRDDDTFIPLRQRVAIARADSADLLISLHADSNPDQDVTGLSIYTLSDGRSDREAAALAKRENQSDVIAGVDLSGENNPVAPILIDLAQRDTINKSSRFATTALASLRNVTDILARSPHRSASLAVLVAPDVPAVLIELGYLSNRGDAAQMNTQSWRARVAGAIADAVDNHFAVPTRQAARQP
ncbi:MAG TPA: N-acetylmuramoyl-L-alanine amidase [Rhizomicrobium sp.]|nr:N-acetylmuramoyl-L-alanine amidase [Rhizomicrobium sp.]